MSVDQRAVTIDGRGTDVWIIGLERPNRRNAVDRPTADALAEAFAAFELDSHARVAILHGKGGVFCSGADLKALASVQIAGGQATELGASNRLLPLPPIPTSPTMEGVILDKTGPMGPTRMLLSKPTIAAISGFCVAGGLELACWCDLRVADSTAQFGVLCRRWGVPLIDGGTSRLANLIGLSRGLDMVLTGRLVDAEEAKSFGLVNRLVSSPNDLLPEALSLAKLIASFPQQCMRADRLSVHLRSPEGTVAPEWRQALQGEFERGSRIVTAESVLGAQQFSGGEGRGGQGVPRAKM